MSRTPVARFGRVALCWLSTGAATALLYVMSRHTLPGPSLRYISQVPSWWRQSGPVLATFGVLRAVLLGVGCYLEVLWTVALVSAAFSHARVLVFSLRLPLPGVRIVARITFGLTAASAIWAANAEAGVAAAASNSSVPAPSAPPGASTAAPVLRYLGPAVTPKPGPTGEMIPPLTGGPAPARGLPRTKPPLVAPRRYSPAMQTDRQAPALPTASASRRREAAAGSTPGSTAGSPAGSAPDSPGTSPPASPVPAPARSGARSRRPLAEPASQSTDHPSSPRRETSVAGGQPPPTPPGPDQPVRRTPPALGGARGTATAYVVQPGDNLWSIAADTLAATWGRQPDDSHVAPYWLQIVEINRPHLPNPADANLIFAGDRIALPPPPAAPI